MLNDFAGGDLVDLRMPWNNRLPLAKEDLGVAGPFGEPELHVLALGEAAQPAEEVPSLHVSLGALELA